MGNKKSSKVEEALKDYVSDEIKDKLDKDFKGTIQDEKEESINELIRVLASQIPGEAKLYLKLYKKSPLPEEFAKQGLVYLDIINDVENIDDIEVYLAELVRRNGYGSGIYQIRVYRTDKKGLPVRPFDLAIYAEEPENTSDDNLHERGTTIIHNQPQDPETVFDTLDKQVELAMKLKELGGKKEENMSPEAMMKALSETFAKGIEIAKGNAPQSQPLNVQTIISIIASAIPVLKEFGLFQKPEPMDMVKMIETLKGLGLVRDPKEDDPGAMITKMKDMMGVVTEIAGLRDGGPAEPQSIMHKLIDTIGPHVPKMVENITDTVKGVAEVSKMKLSHQLGASEIPSLSRPFLAPSSPSIMRNPERIQPLQAPDESTELPPPPIHAEPERVIPHNGGTNVSPIVTKIINAVQTNDITFYQELSDLLKIYVSPVIVQQLAKDEVTVDTILNLASSQLHPFFAQPEARNYFVAFVTWLKGKNKPVKAKCSVCTIDDYEYPTREEFDADNKICEGCGGTIIEIEEGVISA